jgi:Tryptophan/tyrosine permease family
MTLLCDQLALISTTAWHAGLAVPWMMFVAWEAAILGSTPLPPQQQQQQQQTMLPQSQTLSKEPSAGAVAAPERSAPPLLDSNGVLEATTAQPLRAASDPLSTLAARSGVVRPLVSSFSLLAIATSYLGFVLGLTDFLADVLRTPSRRDGLLYLLALAPPLLVALSNPGIFLAALDAAGGCASRCPAGQSIPTSAAPGCIWHSSGDDSFSCCCCCCCCC